MTELYREPLTDRECIDGFGEGRLLCAGPIEFREPLSGTGRRFPRCEKHWAARLEREDELNRRYPASPPRDWSPLDAGESWDDDY